MSQPGRRDDGEAQKEAWPVPSLHEKHNLNRKEQIPQKRQEVSSTSPWNREHGTQSEMWLKQ